MTKPTIQFSASKIRLSPGVLKEKMLPLPKRRKMQEATADLLNYLINTDDPPEIQRLDELIERGADLMAQSTAPTFSALNVIILRNFDTLLPWAEKNGVDIADPKASPDPITFIAARAGNTTLLKRLINDYKVTPSPDNAEQGSLLHAATKGGSPECIKIALSYCKDNINQLDERGNTPLSLVNLSAPASKESIDLLLNAGAAPNTRIKTESNRPPFFDIAHTSSGWSKEKDGTTRIKHTLDSYVGAGANLNLRDENGRTLLARWDNQMVISDKEVEVAKAIIDKGISLTFTPDTPEWADNHSCPAFVQYIRKRVSTVNKEWNQFIADPKPETLDSAQLIRFANIDKLPQLFNIQHWEKQPEQAVERLKELPLYLQESVISQQAWLTKHIQPEATINHATRSAMSGFASAASELGKNA